MCTCIVVHCNKSVSAILIKYNAFVDFSRFLNHSDITPLFMCDLKRQRRRPKRGGVGCVCVCVCGCLCNKKVRKKNDSTQEPSFVSLCCPFLLSFFLFSSLSLQHTLQWRSLIVQYLQTTTTTRRTLSTTMHHFLSSI